MSENLRFLSILILRHLLLLNSLLEMWWSQPFNVVNYDIVRVGWGVDLNYFLNFLLTVKVRLLLLDPIAKIIRPLFQLELLWCQRRLRSPRLLVTDSTRIQFFVRFWKISSYFLLLRNLVQGVFVTPEFILLFSICLILFQLLHLFFVVFSFLVHLVAVAGAKVKGHVIFFTIRARWSSLRINLLFFYISIFIITVILILNHFVSQPYQSCFLRVVPGRSCIKFILV